MSEGFTIQKLFVKTAANIAPVSVKTPLEAGPIYAALLCYLLAKD